MLVRCPECQTGYNLPLEKLGGKGRTVRCIKCNHEWFQEGEKAAEPAEEMKAPIAPENPQIKNSSPSAVSKGRDQVKQRAAIIGLATTVSLLVIFSILVLLKNTVEENVPAMQGFYSFIGLSADKPEGVSITGLSIDEESIERILDEDTMPITYTFVGNVVNTNTVEVKVPQIRVALLDDKGVEIDFWPAQVEKSSLQPGESARWVCRFFNPPIDQIYAHKVYFTDNQ